MPSKSARRRVPTLALAIKPRREAEAWLAPISAALPELRVALLDDVKPSEVDYAAAWGTVAGLDRCPNLKALISLGAGVDHILANASLAHLPVIRMIDPGLTEGMTEFALLQVLHHHRRMPEFNAFQRDQQWKPLYAPLARNRCVGVMGLGILGRDTTLHLKQLGFRIIGWSRSKHTIRGVRTFAGATGLKRFLAQAEILVCLLPLTPETRGILNAETFAQLPKGASVINLARGGHVVEADLLAALNAGHLSGASLDVFHEEPLPKHNPLWAHPKVIVTPHIASLTQRDTGTLFVARSVRSLIAGKRPRGLVDRHRGY
ncbi:MAG TPA: glyoxylate/hydroxypyruvate reductase A [Magnetospirillaceae bacterium]|jgi:glyoxylate/hydroxypyruvate reductase A